MIDIDNKTDGIGSHMTSGEQLSSVASFMYSFIQQFFEMTPIHYIHKFEQDRKIKNARIVLSFSNVR